MSKFDDGMKVRREVLGDAHVDRSIKNASSFDLGFQEYITQTVWGGIWTRDVLERWTRHMVTIAIGVLTNAVQLGENLVVNDVRMIENLQVSNALMLAEALTNELAKHTSTAPCIYVDALLDP